jgi:hypothetical protein
MRSGVGDPSRISTTLIFLPNLLHRPGSGTYAVTGVLGKTTFRDASKRAPEAAKQRPTTRPARCRIHACNESAPHLRDAGQRKPQHGLPRALARASETFDRIELSKTERMRMELLGPIDERSLAIAGPPARAGRMSPALRAPVYHFTDTINLPWILASGELRPCWMEDVGIGRNRFLWGTTNPEGDYTSGAQRRIHGHNSDPILALAGMNDWYAGKFHLVRFTLAADEFFTWNEIVRASNWTPEEVAELIESDRRQGEHGHDLWRLRHDAVPLSRVLKVETTSYDDADTERWWPLDIRARRRGVLLRPNDPKRKGVKIGSRRFYSTPISQDLQFYLPWTPPRQRHPRYETYEDALADARYAGLNLTMTTRRYPKDSLPRGLSTRI